MDELTTSVIVFTGDHLLSGSIDTRNVRVLDILNNSGTDYLTLQDVELVRSSQADVRVAAMREVVIRKEKLALVINTTMRREAGQKRIDTFSQKQAYRAVLGGAGFDGEGWLHVAKHSDSVTTLTHQLGSFFPVTDAHLWCGGAKPLHASVVFVNQSLLGFFYVGQAADQARPESSAAKPQTLAAEPLV